jgi:hypothetical protein
MPDVVEWVSQKQRRGRKRWDVEFIPLWSDNKSQFSDQTNCVALVREWNTDHATAAVGEVSANYWG